MARHTLYAYVNGSDLDLIADQLASEFAKFVSSAPWTRAQPWTVNQKRERDPSLDPEDLQDWELGTNMHLPDPGDEPINWFNDLERIAVFLGQLHVKTGRTFVIGVADNVGSYSEDLYSVESEQPDLKILREVIGVR